MKAIREFEPAVSYRFRWDYAKIRPLQCDVAADIGCSVAGAVIGIKYLLGAEVGRDGKRDELATR